MVYAIPVTVPKFSGLYRLGETLEIGKHTPHDVLMRKGILVIGPEL